MLARLAELLRSSTVWHVSLPGAGGRAVVVKTVLARMGQKGWGGGGGENSGGEGVGWEGGEGAGLFHSAPYHGKQLGFADWLCFFFFLGGRESHQLRWNLTGGASLQEKMLWWSKPIVLLLQAALSRLGLGPKMASSLENGCGQDRFGIPTWGLR